jgi:hypothetical protein
MSPRKPGVCPVSYLIQPLCDDALCTFPVLNLEQPRIEWIVIARERSPDIVGPQFKGIPMIATVRPPLTEQITRLTEAGHKYGKPAGFKFVDQTVSILNEDITKIVIVLA